MASIRLFESSRNRSLMIAVCATCAAFNTLPSIAQSKGPQQVVKPPVALAYVDVATASSDMPGGNMMDVVAQGGVSGGLFGALGGLVRGAAGGVTGGGNTFGQTRNMGFGSGRYVDVSVFTQKNRSLAEATQNIPAAMNLGQSLKLVAVVPDKPLPQGPVEDKEYEPSYEKPRGKISMYWGCSDTIRPGQPRTLDAATARIEDFGKFFVTRGSTTKGARAEPGHPSWPNKQDDRQVPDSASLVGQHAVLGNGMPESFKFALSAAQDLMPPIQLTQGKNETGVDLEWQAVPHVRGYFIAVMGGRSDGADSGEAIFWTSSELPETGLGLLDYQSNSNIDKWISEKVVLPATATRCAVPKGIFSEGAGGMLRMIAYGSDAYFAYPARPADPRIAWEPEWQTKVRVKSTYFSVLGGMGGGEGKGRTGRGQEPKAEKREETKPNAVELFKGLFGR